MSLHHAAEQGDVNSQYELGRCFKEGESNIEKDINKSIFWYMKAAEQGDIEAMYELGNIYSELEDEIEEKNMNKAIKWYSSAAEIGHQESMFSLGLIYLSGEGISQPNEIEAVKWFQLGYDNDHGECIFNLGSLYGQGKVNHYNGSCIEKAMELWQIAANKHNIVEAHFMIAQTHEHGVGTIPQNINAAISSYKAAAQGGYTRAINALERLNIDAVSTVSA